MFLGIIGYSDDDRSDDEDKRSSPLKSLAKSQSKDSLPRRSVSISSLKASANADQAPLVNVSLTPNLAYLRAYGRGASSVFVLRLAPLCSETGTQGLRGH
jgi:hypothetical protein